MGDPFLPGEHWMVRISPHFPRAHGILRADDRRVVSGSVDAIRNDLQRRDAPNQYGPHKSLYSRFMRWGRLGVFDRIFASLAAESSKTERIVIDALHPIV